jgi:hypothetical protein
MLIVLFGRVRDLYRVEFSSLDFGIRLRGLCVGRKTEIQGALY